MKQIILLIAMSIFSSFSTSAQGLKGQPIHKVLKITNVVFICKDTTSNYFKIIDSLGKFYFTQNDKELVDLSNYEFKGINEKKSYIYKLKYLNIFDTIISINSTINRSNLVLNYIKGKQINNLENLTFSVFLSKAESSNNKLKQNRLILTYFNPQKENDIVGDFLTRNQHILIFSIENNRISAKKIYFLSNEKGEVNILGDKVAIISKRDQKFINQFLVSISKDNVNLSGNDKSYFIKLDSLDTSKILFFNNFSKIEDNNNKAIHGDRLMDMINTKYFNNSKKSNSSKKASQDN